MKREDWNRRYATKELVWTADANRFVVDEVQGLQPGVALDLAAGECRNAVWLAERGWTAHAVDFSDVALDKGRRLAQARGVADRLRVEVADLRSFQPDRQAYDLVVVAYLQLVDAELTPILARAAQSVAPGGTFLLVAHDVSNLEHGTGGPQDAAVLTSADQVVAGIDDQLEIEKAGTVPRPVRTDDGERMAIDCLVRARRV